MKCATEHPATATMAQLLKRWRAEADGTPGQLTGSEKVATEVIFVTGMGTREYWRLRQAGKPVTASVYEMYDMAVPG